MLYELIADSAHVLETIEREFDSRGRVSVEFPFVSDAVETVVDRDPLCDESRYGERLARGFELLGIERG